MLNGIALALTVFFYHPVNQYIIEKGKTKWQQVKSLDWIGVFLFAAGLVLFLLGLSFGGNKYPWFDPYPRFLLPPDSSQEICRHSCTTFNWYRDHICDRRLGSLYTESLCNLPPRGHAQLPRVYNSSWSDILGGHPVLLNIDFMA
jgi:hypothetical protein